MTGEATLVELFSEKAIRERVQVLAKEISSTYGNEAPVVFVGILKGAFVFLADLVRAVSFAPEVDFVRLSCYGNGQCPQTEVRCTKAVEIDLHGKHVLIVEDLVDTGRTLSYLKKELEKSGAESVRIAAVVDKKERREVDLNVDFTGFALDSGFIVGYGMDYAERYRHLKGIYEIVSS